MKKNIPKNDVRPFVQEALGLMPGARDALAGLRKKNKKDVTDAQTALYVFFHSIGKSSSYIGLDTLEKICISAAELLNAFLTGRLPKFQVKHKNLLEKGVLFVEESLEVVKRESSDKKMAKPSEKLIELMSDIVEEKEIKVNEKRPAKKKNPEQENRAESESETGFVEGASEVLTEIEESLNLLKDAPGDRSIAATLARKAGVLRGSCTVYGYKHLEKLNRTIEGVFQKLETGTTFKMDELIDVLLIMKDVNHDTLTAISRGDSGEIFDLGSYLQAIDDLSPLGGEEKQETDEPLKPPHEVDKVMLASEPPDEGLPVQMEEEEEEEEEEELSSHESPPRVEEPAGSPKKEATQRETESNMALSPELVEAFVQETDDMLPEIEGNLLTWADSPEDLEIISNVFRRIHSLKGNCGFYGFKDLETLSHQIETILSAAKSGASLDAKRLVDTLLKMKDVIGESVNSISGGGTGAIPGLSELLKELASYSPKQSSPEPPAPDTIVDSSMELKLTPELISIFVNETEELLQELESGLIAWEADPGNKEIIATLFRGLHTLKGNCGFYGFADLEKLSHSVENLLDAAKADAKLDLRSVTKSLLSVKDLIEKSLADIKDGGVGEIQDLHIYIELIEKILPKGWAGVDKNTVNPGRLGNILKNQGVIEEADIKKVVSEQNKPFGEKLVDLGLATPGQVESALKQQKAKIKETNEFSITQSKGNEITKRQNIRVDLDKLDTLINLIGEMAIAENMITNNPEILPLQLESFTKASQHMNKIVRELQEMAMTIRMVPVSGLFRRMIRLVHDLSNKCDKKVDFKLIGEETEVDKTVVEIITDPLVHIIRNSLDHGLEGAEERIRANKNPTGSLTLSANHEEGQVKITITDDGRGLNREKILAKAKENGLVDENASNLTDQKVFSLIFNPGFSTADRITDVSGRGVGMDVVKKNLDKVKGRVNVKSEPGKGTRISLRIPLTLAIIDGMVVKINGLKYVIPVLSIKESFVPDPDVITETPDGSAVVSVRKKFYPVIRFDDLFHDYSNTETKPLTEGVLVLLENQDNNVCLYVDELIGQQQIVIKALSRYIDNVRGVSGCTILGDGEICLIIDVGSLIDSVEQNDTANH